MNQRPLKMFVVGASGSIGRRVVAEAVRQGHVVTALVRSMSRASGLPASVSRVVGDLTKAETLVDAVQNVDAIVFTHGSTDGSKLSAEQVDYGGVRNILLALAGRSVRLAVMSAIGVTNREGNYNRATEAHDWKRRGERLVRASGMPYTIVRPGWFDYNAADQHRLVFLQGDRRRAGDPSDGVVSRQQIAEVLVHSLVSDAACGKTIELVAERGSASTDLDALFTEVRADETHALDAVLDEANMPMDKEPARVREDYKKFASS